MRALAREAGPGLACVHPGLTFTAGEIDCRNRIPIRIKADDGKGFVRADKDRRWPIKGGVSLPNFDAALALQSNIIDQLMNYRSSREFMSGLVHGDGQLGAPVTAYQQDKGHAYRHQPIQRRHNGKSNCAP